MTRLADLRQIYTSDDPLTEGITVGSSTYYGRWVQPFDRDGDLTGLGARFVGIAEDLSAATVGSTVTIDGDAYEVMTHEPATDDLLVTLVLKLTAAEDEAESIEYEEVTSARVTITSGEKLTALESTLSEHPFTSALEVVSPGEDLGYRLTNKVWDDAWLSSGLSYMPAVTPITASGLVLLHDEGESQAVLDSEIDDCISDLEGRVDGLTVEVWAYPEHRHDRHTQFALRDRQIIHARNGALGDAPTGSTLLGTDLNDVTHLETWENWCPWEGTIPAGMSASSLRGLSASELNDWLYDTANAESPPALFGYDSLMDLWKAKNTWVHFYFHNTTELSVAEMEALIDLFQADADVWIERSGVIAKYAHARHAPNGPTHSDPLIFEPTKDFGAAPWQEKKMAVTISFDDPQASAITDLIPAAIAKSCPVTVYVANLNIVENGGSTVTEAQLQAFHDGGLVEIGGHSMNHYLQYENVACKVRDTDRGTIRKAMSVTLDAPNLLLKFYRDAGVDFPLSLGRHLTRWFDAPGLGLADGASITSWTDRKSGDVAQNAAAITTYSAEYRNGLGAVRFPGTGVRVPLIGGPGDIHSNTDGLMVFIAGEWSDSGYRRMLAKWTGASGGYFFHFDPATLQMCVDKTTSSGTVNIADYSSLWPPLTWGVYSIAWTPGTPIRVYFNGVIVATGASSLASMELDAGSDAALTIGGDAAGDGTLVGYLGDIITVNLDDATIRQEMDSYILGADRWDVS